MVHLRDANGLGEIPLGLAGHGDLAASERPEMAADPLAELPVASIDRDGAVGFQVAHIDSRAGVDMIHDVGIGEVAVEGEITRDLACAHPIDQVDAQVGVVLERCSFRLAGLLLAKATELQRVMLAGDLDVIGNQVIMGNQMALIGMIPEPASVLNQLAGMVNQAVINRNHAILTIAGLGVLLQQRQPPVIQVLYIPRRFGQEAVQAGLS
jgi:hypothetical protein